MIEGADQNIVKLWDTKTDKSQIFNFFNPSLLGRINLLGFTKDNKDILCIADTHIYLINLKTDCHTKTSISGQIKSLCIYPKDDIFATGNTKGEIAIWKLTTGSAIIYTEFQAHGTPKEAPINSLAFKPKSKILASAGDDCKIKLWDLWKKSQEKTLGEHDVPINVITFSPDGKFLASGDDSGCIKIWDMNTKKNEVLKQHQKAVTSLSFSPDSKTLISGSKDGNIILWKKQN